METALQTTDAIQAPRVQGRALLVEDDDLVREAFEILLSERLEVDAAASAEEAIARFVPGRYDLLVTDLGLPGRKGHELLRSLRDVDPGLAAVLITAEELSADDPRLSGFERCWHKPVFDCDAVLAGIADVAARSRRRRAG